MGLLNNLKDQALKNANLDKLKKQAMKRASEFVDKAQEKLNEVQSNNESLTTTSVERPKPSMKEPSAMPKEEKAVFEEKVEKSVKEQKDDKTTYHPQSCNQIVPPRVGCAKPRVFNRRRINRQRAASSFKES